MQVGYDKSGLPIGLQFIGKPWSESLLIHIASAMQVSLVWLIKKYYVTNPTKTSIYANFIRFMDNAWNYIIVNVVH